MHYLYFVCVPKDDAKNSEEAMTRAEEFLEAENFCGENLFYSSGKADWYEVGGRWSGFFTELEPWYKKYEAARNKMLKEKYPEFELGTIYPASDKRAQKAGEMQEDIKRVFRQFCPDKTLSAPDGRCGTFSWKGAERSDKDDAVLMTRSLWRKFKKFITDEDYNDTEVVFSGVLDETMVDSVKEKDAIDQWWVVIDYHN